MRTVSKLKSLTASNKEFELLRLLTAIAIAIVLTTIIIFAVSKMPFDALYSLFLGPLGSKRHFFNILEMAVPLTFTGLALSIVFKSGNFSMVSDGALYLGAVIASAVAIKWVLPAGVHPLVGIICASFVGGVIGAIPAILKVKFKANELVTSLMLNYVFFYTGIFIVNKFLIDKNAGNFASLKFAKTASLGQLVAGTRLHFGFIIAIIVSILLYLFIFKTKWGYEIRLVGSNIEFAKHAGINTGKVIIVTQLIAGMVAGMGGGIEQLGMFNRFLWADAPSYAWDGVIIAVLSGNNPKFVPFATFFLAYIRVGADIMSRKTDVQNELVSIIQAIIILLITAERFLYVIKQRKESKLALEQYGE